MMIMMNVILEMICPVCEELHFVETTDEQYIAYENGELAQVAFADLTPTEREQIISHICPACQEKIFG
jgi:hypothetical protein